MQHACGHVRDLLPQMRSSGVAAVESLSPLPTGNLTLAEARDLLGPEIGIVGGIEPVSLLRLDDQAFTEHVEAALAAGTRGPYVCGNSDSMPPGVSLERLIRCGEIIRAARPASLARA
jgi:uroporphyrinogen-III decarboxylase